MKAWRNSASLIILTKELISNSKNAPTNNVRILLQKRSSKSKAFPDAMVFPGGTVEESDCDNHWIEHFRTFGFDYNHFDEFQKPTIPLSPVTLDGKDPIVSHVSLRITAIRETFEELGILMCKPRSDATLKENNKPWTRCMTNFDIENWQKKVSSDAKNFLKLCQELDCYPDIWSLYLWSNWLTPIKLIQTPRFNTVFFIAALEDRPSINIQRKEVSSVVWAKAEDVITAHNEDNVNLIYPQWLELSRLKWQGDFFKLISFARERCSFGCELFYPVLLPATDGIAMLMPGDSMYPLKPNYVESHTFDDPTKTLEGLRSEAAVVNRGEYSDGKYNFRIKNFSPSHFHLSPLHKDIPDIPILPKSSL